LDKKAESRTQKAECRKQAPGCRNHADSIVKNEFNKHL
jgi:hypothetical protein